MKLTLTYAASEDNCDRDSGFLDGQLITRKI
jgi:hypothetical protein